MKTHVGFLPLRAPKSVAATLPDFPPISRVPIHLASRVTRKATYEGRRASEKGDSLLSILVHHASTHRKVRYHSGERQMPKG